MRIAGPVMLRILAIGWHYPITDDMPGRHLFGDAKEFWNPDLPMGASYEDFSAAGERLLHNLMAYAHQRGMECVLGASVTMFPHEFKDMFHGAKPLSGMSRYTMIPGPETKMDDPGLIKLATAVLRTSVNTYPEADYLQLGVTEVRKWSSEYERVWKTLDAKYGLSKVQTPQASETAMEIEPKKAWTLDELLAKANQRRGYPGGVSRAVLGPARSGHRAGLGLRRETPLPSKTFTDRRGPRRWHADGVNHGCHVSRGRNDANSNQSGRQQR